MVVAVTATSLLGVGVGSAAAATPSIAGEPWVGQTLALSATAGATAETWYSCSSATQSTCTATTDTGASYPLTADDVGNYLEVEETEADGTTVDISNMVGPITYEQPAATTAPALSTGAPQQGQTISVSTGTWSPAATSYGYQWFDCAGGTCGQITGATAASYTPGSGDVGDALEVQVTAVDHDVSTTVTAGPTAAVLPVAPSARSSAPPSITGTAADGQTLTASTGTFSGATGYAYKWLSCSSGNCTAISKATNATLKLGDSQVGSTIEVQVTASNAGGSATATSSRTAVVTAGSTLGLLVSPTSANINQTVRMAAIVTSGVSSVQPAGSVTFYDDGNPIAGCTDQSVPATDQSVTVVCPTSFGLSTPTITAAYSPGNGTPLTGSSSSSQSVTVLSDQSTTTLDVPTIVKRGATVTYTANVAPADDLTGPVVPSGSVRFVNHGHTIRGCGQARIAGGAATCTIHYRTTGRQRISAQYAGTASFAGSSSHIKTVRVVSALPVNHGLRPLGAITSTMQWTFHYTPSFTRILALTLHGLSARSTVTIACSGKGCPYHRHAHRFTTAHPNFNLVPAFLHHKLGVKAKVVIMLTRHRYVGKYYRFTIESRRQPAILISCLAPGSQRPGVGCES